MHTKTLLSTIAASFILSACGGSGNAPAVEQPAPFLFSATDGNNGYELWKTGGTAETTRLVKDINASGDSDIEGIIRIGQLGFFTADDGINGDQLWVSDGTDAGTMALAPEPRDLIAFNGQLFFSAGGFSDTHNEELWKSDGTVAGTVQVKEINPNSDSQPENFAVLGDTLYFSADDGTNGEELWKTDGTAAGTVMAADINSTGSSFPSNLVALGTQLLFSADDGTGTDGNELWSFDGSTASLVQNINPGVDNSNPLSYSAVLDGNLYFTAFTNAENTELWKTDGTAAGTALVQDIRVGTGSSTPQDLTTVGSYVFFSADNNTNGRELWKTDGTTTDMVKNINTSNHQPIQPMINARSVSSDPSSSPSSLVGIGGKLYFSATKDSDNELWVSDGTDAGTVLLKDIHTGGSSYPVHLGQMQYFNQAVVAVPDVGVLFIAESAGKGLELWKSDGTAAGTTMIKDINPDAGNGLPPTSL